MADQHTRLFHLRLRYSIQNEVGGSIAKSVNRTRVGIAGEVSGVVERAEKALVIAGDVVVLIADCLDSHAERMHAVLPRQVVAIAVGVVDD